MKYKRARSVWEFEPMKGWICTVGKVKQVKTVLHVMTEHQNSKQYA
jgi:hypothetical protein